MRRPAIWILICALVLLAICVVLLLARMLAVPAPPGTNLAAADSNRESIDLPEPVVAGVDTAVGASAAGIVERDAPATAREPEASSAESPGRPEDFNPPGRIVGRVVDSSGRGVGGATVLAAHAPDLGQPVEARSWWIAHLPLDVADPHALGAEAPKLATTDEDGSFSIESFEPGRVRLAVRSPRTDPLDRNDLWLASGSVLLLDTLRVEAATSLSGRVFDPDGRPILGASIVRVDEFFGAGTPVLSPAVGIRLAETNGRGHFRTQPLGPGACSILVSGGLDLTDLGIAQRSAREGWELEVDLQGSERITGRVRTSMRNPRDLVVRALPLSASATSVPFACRVDAREAAGLPNLDFELRGLAPGTVYELRASQRGRAFEVDSAWSPPVLAIAGDDRTDVAWEPDASVTFHAIGGDSREPFGACAATLTGFDPERVDVPAPSAESLGLSAIEGLRPSRLARSFRLRIVKPGYLPVEQDLSEVRPGYSLALGDLKFASIPAMRVRVADARTGAPIERAGIVAIENPSELEKSSWAIGTSTDREGEARIRSFAGTASGIEVRAAGYAPARRYGPFGGGFSEAFVEVALFRGATVTVRCVDAAGEPIAAARIEHIEGDWSPNEAPRAEEVLGIGVRPDPRTSRIADGLGTAVFRQVAPGRHAFRVGRHRTYLDGEWSLRVLREGEAAEIVLVSQAPAALQVRVRDGGTLLAGAPVELLRQADVPDRIALLDPRTPLPPGIDAWLDGTGATTFENLAPGWYFLVIGIASQGVRAFREVHVTEEGSSLEVDLSRRAIVGTVVDPTGAPVAGAEVRLVAWDRRMRDRSLSSLEYFGDPDVRANGLEIVAATTDEDGSYRILGLPHNEAFLTIARAGTYWSGAGQPVHVGPDDLDTQANLAIAAAGAIEVRIATRPGVQPCVLAAVSQDRRTLPRIQRIFSGRNEVVGGLEPGWWNIRIDAGGLGKRRERVEVVAGATSVLEFALP